MTGLEIRIDSLERGPCTSTATEFRRNGLGSCEVCYISGYGSREERVTEQRECMILYIEIRRKGLGLSEKRLVEEMVVKPPGRSVRLSFTLVGARIKNSRFLLITSPKNGTVK